LAPITGDQSETAGIDVSRHTCGILVAALGPAFVAGCGGSGQTSGRDAAAAITATATVTATVTATATATPAPTGVPSDPTISALVGLVEREYPEETLRDLARSICEEARSGEGDPSHPWREEIG